MAPANQTRFAARPVNSLVDAIADALSWPRSRPARVLAGERLTTVARIVICGDDGALADFHDEHDTLALLSTPPVLAGERTGRRTFDPFVGAADGGDEWRRAGRVVLDAALLLAGGAGGIDERICSRLGMEPLPGLRDFVPLRQLPRDVDKFVGYVPTDSLDLVRDAVFTAGAGHIGGYDRCSWSTAGEGTFRGGEGTDPAVGVRGEFERVAETRFEVVVPRERMAQVTRAYIAAHPYEEPAFDVVHLELPSNVGFGRIGILGPGGGAAAWTALSAIDPNLHAYGAVDKLPSGAVCAVHSGPARDVLTQVLAEPNVALLVTSHIEEFELEALAAIGIAVLVIDRAHAVGAFQAQVAGMLTRALTMPVTVEAGLLFPDVIESVEHPDVASSSLPDPAPLDVFANSPAPAADPAVGTWRLHFDGGSRGNPGPAAYGWVLYDPSGTEAATDGVRVGSTTNNVAEWTGLLRGVESARSMGVRSLAIRGDSELVVKQVTGVYKVKNAALKTIADQVAHVLRDFDRIDVAHVYRADNARADEIANEAMDGIR